MDRTSKNLVAVARGVLARGVKAELEKAYQQQGIEDGGFEWYSDKDRKWHPMEVTVRTLDDAKHAVKKHGILVRQVFHAQVMLEPNERAVQRPRWID